MTAWYPVETVTEDKLRDDTNTRFILKSINFSYEIPVGTFTLENLRSSLVFRYPNYK